METGEDHSLVQIQQRRPKSKVYIPVLCLAVMVVVMIGSVTYAQIYAKKLTAMLSSTSSIAGRSSSPKWHKFTNVRQDKIFSIGFPIEKRKDLREKRVLITNEPNLPSDVYDVRYTEQVYNEFTLYPDDQYNGDSRMYCFYRLKNRQGRRVNKISYGLHVFPYHLCTHAIYCCSDIDPLFNITAPRTASRDTYLNELKQFRDLKDKNPYLKVFIGIGSTRISSNMYSKLCKENLSRIIFQKNLRHLLQSLDYDGVMIHWERPDKYERDCFTSFLKELKGALKGTSYSTSVVVPLWKELRQAFDIGMFFRFLDEHTILVDPVASLGRRSYRKTFTLYNDEVVKNYATLYNDSITDTKDFRTDGKFYLCYPMSLEGITVTIKESHPKDLETAAAIGPGRAGDSTNLPGQIAFDEVCKRNWSRTRMTKYNSIASSEDQWVAFLEESGLRDYILSIENVTGNNSCFGVWDPEWDDFAGFCGRGEYPLTRSIFLHQTADPEHKNQMFFGNVLGF